MSRILRFFVCLGTLFFASNALAAGYSCSSLPKYLSCQHGYYMTSSQSSTTYNGTPKVGNYCQPCSRMGSNYTCAGGTAAPVQSAGGYTCPTYMKYTSCSTGYYMTDSSTSTTYNGSPKVRNACRPCSVYGANYTCAGGTAAPQAITINVTCPKGQYLPQGATSCTTCPAGSFCPGQTCNGVSLVTGATSACGLSSCSTSTGALYTNSASGSSSINDCYLTLSTTKMVGVVNGGKVDCVAGYYCDNGGRNIYYDENGTERGLTDSRPTIGGGEACARGSISGSTGWDICRPCPDGTTSPGTGTSSPSGCNITCSNSANVAKWVTPTWTPNYVSNLCKIDSCVACTKGTGVASCSASIVNNACTYTATCASGYKNPTCNGSSCSCEISTYTVTLNATANGGTGGTSVVYQMPGTGWYSNAAATNAISSITMPTKTNSVFNGYYSAQSGGTRYITNAGALPSNTPFSSNTTLYAQYSAASCNVTNGSATMSISGNKVSCAVTCNTGYSQSGGTNATTSFTVTGAVGTASVSASCSPRTFTVSLMNYDGTSTHSTIYEKYATGWYSNSAATTTLSKATVPTRAGYLFRGFYTAKQSDVSANGGSGTRRITADGTLPANTTFTANTPLYAAWAKDCTVPENGSCTATIGDDGSVSYITSCNTGYTLSGANTANPTCTPKIYTITLNATAGGGTGGTSTIYLKYATGWYSDAAATNAITSITMPTKTNSICEGYFFDETFGSDRFIGRAGNIIASNTAFTANTTWYAHYEDASCNITNGSGTVDYIRDNAVTCYVTCNTGYSRYGGTDTITSFSKGGSAGYGWVIGQCFARTSTVSFDANGGTGGQSANVTAKYDSAMPSISTTAPTRTGYAFMGWYDNATYTSGTQYYTAAGASARTWDKVADATLYAGWKVNSYTCSAGQYLKAGATSCSSCEAGRACAGGTYSYNASSAQGRVDCTGRTQFSAASAAKCSTVSTGYYTTGCNSSNNNCTGQSQCTSGTWCASGVQNQCSSLSGVSVTGGTYTSAAGSSANTACKYTAPSKTITGCKTVTTNTVTYSGTAWPATTYGVTANGGYIISGNNTATATCNQCSGAVWSAGGTATSCSACPAQTSGWTRNSGTGWTAVTQCNQTKSVGGNCSAGVLKQNATSATAWGTTTISTPLQAKPGSIVNGQKCDQCSGAVWSAGGTATSCSACPAQTSGWTRNSGTGWTAVTQCNQTKSVGGNCSAGVLKQNATSATAWGTTTISTPLQAKPGSIVNGQKCDQCSGAVWSAGGTATSCSACPAQTSGWTRNSGTGWTAVTQCNQTKSVGGNCSAGVLKQNATSATAWGTTTISTPLQAKPGSIVNGQKCDQCSGAVWSAGGTATSCSACPAQTSGWTRNSGTGWTAVTQCNQTKSVGGNCSAGVLKQNATSTTAWGSSTISTPLQAKPGYIVSGQTCTGCVAGTYSAGGTATSCSACTGRTKYSAANASACSTVSTGYYTTGCNSSNNNCTGQSQCTSGTWCASGVQNQCSSLSGVSVTGGTYTSAAGSSANTACKYTAPSKTITGCKTVTTNTVTYSGTAWPATTYGVTANGGYIISGNNTAAATCSQCGTAKYSAGGTATSCSSCPNADSGWTATSPAGSTAYTACYEYQTPANCASGSVKRAASSATAYSSTISLLSTLKSKAGYYASTTATSCTICPAGSSCAASATAPTTCANWTYAASTGMSSCTACPALTSGWTKADSTGTGWKSHTNCVQISPKPANCAGGNLKQVAASNGATTWGASTVNSALSSNPGYYINGTACSACTGAEYYGGGTATSCTPCPSIYTSDTTAAKSKAEQCAVQTTAGKYIATAKATEQTKCPAKNYCPSESVKYGETNSPTACPTADATTARTTYPDDYLNPTRLSINNQGWSTGLPAITSCSANYSFTNAAGHFIVESVGYNSTTGKYENGGSKYYTSVNAGWYLVDKYSDTYCNTSTNPMYYHNVAECTANSYCPGYKSMPLCSTGTHNDEMGRFACRDLGNGYNYSPAKSGAETACYLTTSNSKFVAAAGAAESACTAGGWCPGGVRVNYGSTGGRNTCPTKYPSSSASSNSELDCYVTTAAGKYVATVGAGQVNCAGTGYYCPGGTNVYSGAYGSRLTTGGRTQCPAGYRDLVATASTTKEAQCTMNVAGGKYVAKANESAASGTCAAGYAKAAHSVTYGNTSSCTACTGATYAASTGQASCTTCPTAKTYASAVKSYGYWNNGKDGDHTISDGCYATMTGTLSNGSLTEHGCYLGTDGDYGNGGGKRCYVHQDNLKCNAGYYASTLSNGYVWNNTRAGLLGNTCVGVGAGYYSAANILTRNQCPTGLTTIGYGAGADEVTDCGRILHFGNDKLYLRSGKKTTPSLNVKIGDTTYYGNMTAGTGKGKLRLKSGTTTYSVHDDSM